MKISEFGKMQIHLSPPRAYNLCCCQSWQFCRTNGLERGLGNQGHGGGGRCTREGEGVPKGTCKD